MRQRPPLLTHKIAAHTLSLFLSFSLSFFSLSMVCYFLVPLTYAIDGGDKGEDGKEGGVRWGEGGSEGRKK